MAAAAAGIASAEVTFTMGAGSGLMFANQTDSTYWSNTDNKGDASHLSATMDTWEGDGRMDVTLKAKAQTDDEKHGIYMEIRENGKGNGFMTPDQAYAWTTLGMFRFKLGRIELDDLRGSIGDWGKRDAHGMWRGENDVFARFYPKAGMTVDFQPVNGLFIGASIDTTGTKYDTENKNASAADIDGASQVEALENIQFGIGYTIEDTVQLKAQYVGDAGRVNNSSVTEDYTYGRVEVGADLLMLGSNLVEIGFKVPIQRADDKVWKGGTFSAFDSNGQYGVTRGYTGSAVYAGGAGSGATLMEAIVSASGDISDAMKYKAQLYTDLDWAGKEKKNGEWDSYYIVPTIGVGGGLQYDLGPCAIGGTVGYEVLIGGESKGNSYKDLMSHTIGGELFVSVPLPCGVAYAGVADKVTLASWKSTGDTKGKYNSNWFAIPVGIDISF